MTTERGRQLLIAAFVIMLPLVTPRIRGADEIEYFSYLRSAVFDADLDFDNEYRHFYARDPEGLAGFRQTFLERVEPATGRRINFAPAGSAILWSPFYLVAHLGVVAIRAVGLTAWEADGFSLPYVAAVTYASALYGFLGLLGIYELLTRFGRFPVSLSLVTTLAVWYGTPVLYYMTLAPGYSHACSLFAVALICLRSARHFERGPDADGPRAWAITGVLVGIAGLVREQDALFGVVPLAVLLASFWRTDRARELMVRGVALGGLAIVTFLPQLFAYHAVNGSFRPSRLVARKMTFWSPHFVEVLADPGHGLIFWSPLLALALIGWVVAVRHRPAVIAWALLAALILQVWINGSVESWTQAGAFGSRRFVAATPVLAWGLAVLGSRLSGGWQRRGPALIACLAIWWNVSLMIQFGLKLMDRQRLEWPDVAVRQFVEVPRQLGRTTLLFFTDRERLVEESR